jgi:hypothetical protein
MTDNIQHLNVKYLRKLFDVVFMELEGGPFENITVPNFSKPLIST